MANYIGAKCPVCEKNFTQDDDIVVCPICGTPHHRACYQQIGTCTFAHLHSEGHTWEPPPAQESEDASGMPQAQVCSTCGTANPTDTIFCLTCGTRLGENGTQPNNAVSYAYTAAFGGVSPNEEILGVSARDLALYVGTGSHYFLPRFREMAAGKPFTFNAPALLSFFYFFYRKMYAAGAVLLGFYVACLIPSFAIASEMMEFLAQHFQEFLTNMDLAAILNTFQPHKNLWAVALLPFIRYLFTAVPILLSLFGNRIYLHSAIYNIRKIRALCEQAPGGFDDAIYTEMLARRGRTSFGVVIMVMMGILAVYFAVCILLMLPHLETLHNTIG